MSPTPRHRPPHDPLPDETERAGARAALPGVAIVVPCYGQAHFLAEALGSLAAQSHPPAQVIVVDDGSPDDVAAALAPFPEVELLRQSNAGLPAARNRGLRACTAPLVVFLDADDRLLPHALEVNAESLRQHPEAAFSWGFNRPFADDGRALTWGATSFRGAPSYGRLLETNVVGAPVGAMFRRRALEAVGGFREHLRACEDYDLYLRLAREHPFVCVGQVVAEYRHHPRNMSGDLRRMYDAFTSVLDDQDDWVSEDAALEAARDRGRKDAALRYDLPDRIDAAARDWREGRRGSAVRRAIDTWRRYPIAFPDQIRRRLG